MNNIILIGLPGAGKSTVGVILAKTLGMKFIDTDLLIQERAGRLLQDIINTDGTGAFLQNEAETIRSLDCHNTVIATGGSVVLSTGAMEHLKSSGTVICLKIPYGVMVRRLRNINTRGIVLVEGQNLRDMYEKRIPLYEKYADITIGCAKKSPEKTVDTIVAALQQFPR